MISPNFGSNNEFDQDPHAPAKAVIAALLIGAVTVVVIVALYFMIGGR